MLLRLSRARLLLTGRPLPLQAAAATARSRGSPSSVSVSSVSSSLSSQEEDGASRQNSPSAEELSPQDAKKTAVRQALQQGTLGMGFSAGGFLYAYHLGVLWELNRLKVLPPPGDPGFVKLAGSSAGSLAIVTFACGLEVDKAMQAMLELAGDCRSRGTRGRLGHVLRDFLHAYLPRDAHERCRDMTYVHLTRVAPILQPEVVHRFHDKDDLVGALVASCHIPLYANGSWVTTFRGRYYVDGGVGAFMPRPPTPTAIKVCCFPVSDILARLQPALQASQTVAEMLDVAISPSAFEPWEHSYAQVVQWALLPAPDDTLKYLVAKGRRDALAWATSMDLLTDASADAEERRVERKPVPEMAKSQLH